MNILTVFGAISLLFGLCSAQNGNMNMNHDPDSDDKCEEDFNPSTPVNPLRYWDDSNLDTEWFPYVKSAKKLPRKYKDDLGKNNCAPPENPLNDTRVYYWQLACPYDVFWLGKFKWNMQQEGLEHKAETCYVVSRCLQPVRALKCTSKKCKIRSNRGDYHGQNSACFETTFHKYRVWVFCPETFKKYKKEGIQPVDCKTKPNYCVRCVTIYVAQCCECCSCWDSRRTMPPAMAPAK